MSLIVSPVPENQAHREPWGIPEFFVISQTALPAMLYLPGTQALRTPLRIGAFAISFSLLAWWAFSHLARERQHRHPSLFWVVAIVAVIALMLFHPQTTTFLGGVAHIGLYLCVLAPVLWAPSLVRTPTRLRRLMALLLVCNGLNATVGVLQVYDPARWLPDQFSRLVTQSEMGLGPVSYTGKDGQLVVRPPGLFDTPGAVAGPGMYAALIGLIFSATRFALWQRVICLGFSFAGLAAIYLSHVRVSMVVAVGMLIVYFAVLALQQRRGTAAVFGATAAAVLFASLVFAVSLAGTEVFRRFATLFASDPFTVYYTARGGQLSYAFQDTMFDFPFGAGLARWGMVSMYFGRPTLDTPSLWAEIQLAGWMIDGGIALMAFYCAALATAASYELRLARQREDSLLAACAAAVFAANLGPIAMIFSFTPFATQVGVQYWFLAGALHGVAQQSQETAERARAIEAEVAPI